MVSKTAIFDKVSKGILTILPYLLLITAIVMAVTRVSHFFILDPRFDSTVFRTVAHTWLNGGLPYVDAYDHKGPLLFLINAIGMVTINYINGPVILAIWSVVLAIILTFFAVKHQVKSSMAAGLSIFIALSFMNLPTININAPEAFTVLFIATSMLILVKTNFCIDTFRPKAALSLGVLCGLCLITSAKNAEIFGGLALFWTYYFLRYEKMRVPMFKNGLLIVLGCTFPIIPFMLYFAAHDAFMEFMNGWIFYGFNTYNEFNEGHDEPIHVLRKMHWNIPAIPVLFAALFVLLFLYCFCLKDKKLYCAFSKKGKAACDNAKLHEFSQTLFFITCSMVAYFLILHYKGANLGNRYFSHGFVYYAMGIALALKMLWHLKFKWVGIPIITVWIAYVLFYGNHASLYRDKFVHSWNRVLERPEITRETIGEHTGEIIDYITKHTKPDDHILIAGEVGSNPPFIHGYANVLSSTRYIVMNERVMKRMGHKDIRFMKMMDTMINDVYCKPPKYILVEEYLRGKILQINKFRIKAVKRLFIRSYYTKVHSFEDAEKQVPRFMRYRFRKFERLDVYEIKEGAKETMKAKCGTYVSPALRD